VIANRDCPAFAELVDDGGDGFLCTGAEEIAAALERLLADPELAARLGAAGKAKALARYTWEGMAANIGDALAAAAGASASPGDPMASASEDASCRR
jgi:glycosyltransferase involved in cell wall biosynthesis